MSPGHRRFNRLGAALLAGGLAIVLNTLALNAADLFDLETARGGLLRLIVSSLPRSVDRLGIASAWTAINGPPISSKSFQTGFHLFVGLLMALFYAFSLEPYLPRSTAAKGWIYAIAVWLLNACVVLPTSGEGFAGSAHLTAAGMLWYAASHTLFFLTLAYGFALVVREPKPALMSRLNGAEHCHHEKSCLNVAPIRSSAQSTWSPVMTSGGAMRIVCPWVSLARMPLLCSALQ